MAQHARSGPRRDRAGRHAAQAARAARSPPGRRGPTGPPGPGRGDRAGPPGRPGRRDTSPATSAALPPGRRKRRPAPARAPARREPPAGWPGAGRPPRTPKASASAQSSGSPTPTTTCPCGTAGWSRTTTTGQPAWADTYRLTEPSVIAVNAADPAGADDQHRRAGPDPGDRLGGRASQRIGRDHQARSPRGGPGRRHRQRLLAFGADEVGDVVAVGPQLERDGPGQQRHGGHDPQRRGRAGRASAAAHSTARRDSSEPSVAATMALIVMAGPPCSSPRHHRDLMPARAGRAFGPYLGGPRSGPAGSPGRDRRSRWFRRRAR